jgi:CheY-like chemotaxis protein
MSRAWTYATDAARWACCARRAGTSLAPPADSSLTGLIQERFRVAGNTCLNVTAFRLLVVEDDPELRSVLSRGLGEEGFEVEAVGDAAAAMARTGDVPDGLVIDIGLPDADGRDLCQALRARGVDAPVLFLTARDAMSDRLSGFGAGGDDYVTKPFHFDEVSPACAR